MIAELRAIWQAVVASLRPPTPTETYVIPGVAGLLYAGLLSPNEVRARNRPYTHTFAEVEGE